MRLFLLCLLAAPTAHAHSIDPDRLYLAVRGDTIHLTATPDMSLFSQLVAPEQLTHRYVMHHREALFEAFMAQLEFAHEVRVVFWDLALTHAHDERAHVVRITIKLQFDPKTTQVLNYRGTAAAPLRAAVRTEHSHYTTRLDDHHHHLFILGSDWTHAVATAVHRLCRSLIRPILGETYV